MRSVLAALAACIFPVMTASAATSEIAPLAGTTVAVWAPDGRGNERLPVILFSHGVFSCATQSRFLTMGFADAGYLVFAPNHRDSMCDRSRMQIPANALGSWDDTTFRDRADDLRNLIAAIRAEPRFAARADFARLALVGHSLGGYTVLGLAGAWPSWKLPGVKAVLALSPYVEPYLTRGTFKLLGAPVMYQGGTRDIPLTPPLRRPGGAYDQSPPPKFYFEFEGAGHLAWQDNGDPSTRDPIFAVSLAFLDHYVKGLPPAPELTYKSGSVALFRYEAEFGRGGDALPANGQPSGRP
jgi:pimeloyl-ACP methyl ester carboxylesterase